MSNFSITDLWSVNKQQIKPLTEDEKAQKLAELREKMAAKRAIKAKEEQKEQIANEAIRRKSGKVLGFAPWVHD